MENKKHYIYEADVVEAYDGDTVTLNIDFGDSIWKLKEKCRLYRINTPEVRGQERPHGLISRNVLREKIVGKKVVIETHKDKRGKYGRLLVDIWLDGENINDWLVSEGLAEYKDY